MQIWNREKNVNKRGWLGAAAMPIHLLLLKKKNHRKEKKDRLKRWDKEGRTCYVRYDDENDEESWTCQVLLLLFLSTWFQLNWISDSIIRTIFFKKLYSSSDCWTDTGLLEGNRRTNSFFLTQVKSQDERQAEKTNNRTEPPQDK